MRKVRRWGCGEVRRRGGEEARRRREGEERGIMWWYGITEAVKGKVMM